MNISTRSKLGIALLAGLVALVIVPASALVTDVDGNGTQDLLQQSVGGYCGAFYPRGMQGPMWGRYTVRGPIVAPIFGSSSQRVAWRARFLQLGTNRTLAYGNWTFATIDRRTLFTNSQYYEHDAGITVVAVIDASWQTRNGHWLTRTIWVNNLSFGTGTPTATVPITTPGLGKC